MVRGTVGAMGSTVGFVTLVLRLSYFWDNGEFVDFSGLFWLSGWSWGRIVLNLTAPCFDMPTREASFLRSGLL